MKIKVYATLRAIVGGASLDIEDRPMTAGQMLDQLFVQCPALRDEIFDPQGELTNAVHILLNGRDVRYIDGLETTITPNDDVRLFPPVGGG